MNERVSAWMSGLVLSSLMLGCQVDPEMQRTGIDTEQTVPDEGQIVERADARTRAKAHTELAGAYYSAGNLAIALEETRIALAADPTYAPAYNMQGLVSVEMRDNAAAELSFKKGLQLSPQDADLNHNYGWFLCRMNRQSEATQWFMNAIKNPLYQTPARSNAEAGRCLSDSKPIEAAEFFERALRADPNNPGTLYSYADLQYRRGLYNEAQVLIARYNRLVKEPPVEALWLALRVARKLGDRGSEASYAAQLQRRFPASPQSSSLQRGIYE
jgi:type IV pilus assembly protein PilF